MIFPNSHAGFSFKGMRIGLLGGSFNPAHGGHLAMSLFALKRLDLDQVWWLVSPQNPLKSSRGMMTLDERITRARNFVKHPRIVVTGIEAELNTRYTADTLSALCTRFPSTHFVWLMGSDNLRQIPRWDRWTDIFALTPIAVFRRQGSTVGGAAAVRFAHARRPASSAKKLAGAETPAWLELDNSYNLLSSTQIRSKILSP